MPAAPVLLLNLVMFCYTWNPISGGCTVPSQSYQCPEFVCDCTFSAANGTRVSCKEISLGCNRRVPASLQRIPELPDDLQSLILRNTDVKTITSEDFKGCHGLRSLELRHNSISSIAIDAFSDLANLEYLNLVDNHLRLDDNDSFPFGVLDPLTSLLGLRLHCNLVGKLSAYREDIFRRKPSLESISLDAVSNATLPSPGATIQLGKLTEVRISDIVPALDHQFDNWDNVPIQYLAAYTSLCHPRPLSKIDVQIFKHLPYLEALDISWNPNLTLMGNNIMTVLKALNGSKVQRLFLRRNGNGSHDIDRLSTKFFMRLKSINLTELYLDGNGIVDLEPRTDLSRYLPTLEVLSLPYNRLFGNVFSVINRTANMAKLRVINFNKQTRSLPVNDGLAGRQQSVLSNSHDVRLHLPPNLKELHMSDAIDNSYPILSQLIVYGGAQNISLVDLSANRFRQLKGPLIMHNSQYSYRRIEILNFSDCDIAYICTTLFPPGNQLKIISLDLSNNFELGQFFIGDEDGEILGSMNQTGIEVLNISGTFITYLHDNFFRYLTTLRELILRDNALVIWPDSINQLDKLIKLDLSLNKFVQLPAGARSFLDDRAERSRIVHLDISRNPLLCSCNTVPFLRWLLHLHRSIILDSRQEVLLLNGTLSRLDEVIRYLETNCYSDLWAKVTGGMCALMFTAMYVAVFVHRNWWTIRYFFVELSRRRQANETPTTEEEGFEYDAFVAYHKNSLTWLLQEMVERLEGRLTVEPLKLCLHHRDWLPGIPIEENVLASIKKSRKTVILLTRSFLLSNWCDFELQMARIHGFDEGHDVLVVIQLEEIPINQMSRTLVNLRKTQTWLELPEPDDAEATEVFWERLRKALKSWSRKPSQCICGRSISQENIS